MRKTVAIATSMKTSVATIDRFDERAMPHTPWPLVQPLPSRVPNPTSSPATISVGQPASISTAAPRRARTHRRARRARSGDEQHAPRGIAAHRFDDAGEDAAHAGDPAVGHEQERRRETDKHAADETTNRGEFGHGSALRALLHFFAVALELGVEVVGTYPARAVARNGIIDETKSSPESERRDSS